MFYCRSARSLLDNQIRHKKSPIVVGSIGLSLSARKHVRRSRTDVTTYPYQPTQRKRFYLKQKNF